MTKNFEQQAKKTEEGVEFWLARDLQILLGYTEWRNFLKTISKAKISCKTMGNDTPNHFVDANKMVKIGSDSEREINDIMLTRYACYLIAQNWRSLKERNCFCADLLCITNA